MKVTEHEMRGLLTGKCVPADMLVNEELPAYLVRKFADLHSDIKKQETAYAQAVDAILMALKDKELVQDRLEDTEDKLQESREKLDAVLGESAARGEIVERLIGQYSCAGYHAVQNSMNPAQSLLYDAMQVQKSGSTSTIANELRAEGVECLAKFAGEEYQRFAGDKATQRKWKGITLLCCDFAAQLRAGSTEGANHD